jgi:LPXTG-motif cell wall-anchored protein
VVGDSDFVTNGYLANANNGSLFANVLNWMLERENQLGIEAKTPEQVRLTMTAAQMSTARWMVLAGMPLAAIAAGILVQRRRRRR